MHKKKDKALKTRFFKYYFSKKRNIFIYLFKILKSIFKKEDILYANGSHLISGYPGSGKTLLMNKIINSVDREKYFFISNLKEFNDVLSFDLNDLFVDSKQSKSIPTTDCKGRKLYAIIFDEINLNYNRRLNKAALYNNTFVGLIEFLVSHRHQNIPRIYFIGQKLELQDTQLQSLFKYQHDIIRTQRFPYYWYYYKNNYINFIPKSLFIVNRVKSIDDEFIELNYLKYKINKNDLETYNTFALANNYINLEKLKLH